MDGCGDGDGASRMNLLCLLSVCLKGQARSVHVYVFSTRSEVFCGPSFFFVSEKIYLLFIAHSLDPRPLGWSLVDMHVCNVCNDKIYSIGYLTTAPSFLCDTFFFFLR